MSTSLLLLYIFTTSLAFDFFLCFRAESISQEFPPVTQVELWPLSNSQTVRLTPLTHVNSSLLICIVAIVSIYPEISSSLRCCGRTLLHDAPIALNQSEVCVSGGAGAADHLAGAHHALLSHPEGGQRAVPGLVRRGVGRGAQDLHLHAAGLCGVQWVPTIREMETQSNNFAPLKGSPAVSVCGGQAVQIIIQ